MNLAFLHSLSFKYRQPIARKDLLNFRAQFGCGAEGRISNGVIAGR